MMMLSLMDPVGTERRKKRRLLRRIYRSKVGSTGSYNMIICMCNVSYQCTCRDQTSSGMLMDMIN